MKIVGLTGGIACGKSTVSERLKTLGVPILDADAIAHRISQPGGEIYEAYVRHFGEECLNADGTLNRQYVAAVVFHDPRERAWMDSVTHPLIRSEMSRELEQKRQDGAKLVILDVPLLFEVGWNDFADENWVVTLDHETQLKRLMERDGISSAEAEIRIQSQMPLSEKCRLADIIIDNSKDVSETYRQVDHLWEERCDG